MRSKSVIGILSTGRKKLKADEATNSFLSDLTLCQDAIRPERIVVGPLMNDSGIGRVRCEAGGPKPSESDSRLISIEAVGRSTS